MDPKRAIRSLRTVFLDLLFAGVVLVVFALFHHVLPRDAGNAGELLPTPVPTTASLTAPPSPTTAAVSPDPTASPSPVPTVLSETSFTSPSLSIAITTFQRDGATGYVADLRLADPLALRTFLASGGYRPGASAMPTALAESAGALLAVNGDYFGIRNQGVVLRDGVLYRTTPYKDVLVMYRDGSMRTFSNATFDVDALKSSGAWQAWSFGPMLLRDGEAMDAFDSNVPGPNPRTAIGYYEPGHYCIVVVDGRQPGYSDGMSLAQLSRLFRDLGCAVAYNLDGGQSSAMVFDGRVVNRPYRGGRQVSDIVYVSLPEEAA